MVLCIALHNEKYSTLPFFCLLCSSNASTTPLPVRDVTPCEVGMPDCHEYEECIPVNNKSKNGLCYCMKGYERDSVGMCVSLSAQQTALGESVGK